MLVPQLPNERWSLDFVADQFIDGRRMRMLIVVDDCTRECLALIPDTSISGIRVARELDRLLADRGKPKMIVSDNLECDLAMVGRSRRRLALHCAGEADAERLRRVIYRLPARRVAQRDAVPIAAAYPRPARSRRADYNTNRPHSRLGWLPSHLRSRPAVRCASLTRRLRYADRRHHRPAG